MKLVDIGKTAEGRQQYMAIISSPENIKKLDHYREISQQARRSPKGLTDDQAQHWPQKAKPSSGSTAACTPPNRRLPAAHRDRLRAATPRPIPRPCASSTTTSCSARFANPDGMELVSNWYMRDPDPTKRLPRTASRASGRSTSATTTTATSTCPTCRNHQHEPRAVPRVVPADHVQPPPDRTRRRRHLHAALPRSVQLTTTTRWSRWASKRSARPCTAAWSKRTSPAPPCAAARTYSTWYNGGLRTITYFHNMIGILTEIIGSPTPIAASAGCRDKQLPTATSSLHPIAPADVALPPVDRLRDAATTAPCSTGLALSRDFSLQHLSHGQELHPKRAARITGPSHPSASTR